MTVRRPVAIVSAMAQELAALLAEARDVAV